MIAGSGNVADVSLEAERLGIAKNIEFTGWVVGAEKSALLGKAAIFVLPSYAEGLPMALLEAMSCGTAVIATDVGGVAEVVENEKNGLLVPPGDVRTLGWAINHLLTDCELRERLGKAGRAKVVSAFGPTRTIAALNELYSAALG